MAVASATECGLTIESENNACMIMVLMPSAATKAIIQKIILTNKGRDSSSANSTSKCKITKCFCKSTPLVLRNSISFLVSH